MITRADISRRQVNGARNKRIKTLVHKLVAEYLQGRSASACMNELVEEARK
jgi:hypothetical protein